MVGGLFFFYCPGSPILLFDPVDKFCQQYFSEHRHLYTEPQDRRNIRTYEEGLNFEYHRQLKLSCNEFVLFSTLPYFSCSSKITQERSHPLSRTKTRRHRHKPISLGLYLDFFYVAFCQFFLLFSYLIVCNMH